MTHELPEGWKTSDLTSICQNGLFTDGDWIESKDQDPNGEVRLIQLADIGDGVFIDKSSRFVTIDTAKRLKCTHIEWGDILIARMPDPIGRACLFPLDQPSITAVDVCIVRPLKETTNSTWLMNAINRLGFRMRIDENATGTTRKRISRKNLGKLELWLPPKAEQARIAEVLTSVDDAIRATQAVIEQTRTVKKGLLQTLLTQGLGHTKFKTSPLGPIPASWAIKRQGDVAKYYNGRAYKKTEWEEEGVPVIRLQNLTGRGHKFYYSSLQLPKRQYCDDGDLLYMWSATFGPHIWQRGRAIYHYHIWKIICDEISLTKIFQYYFLDFKTQQWKSSANGMAMLHLTKNGMEDLHVPLPPIEEQKKIAERLQAVDLVLNENEQKLTQLQTLKSGLMSDLLTGRVRVGGKC